MTEAEAGVVWPEPRGWKRQEGFSLQSAVCLSQEYLCPPGRLPAPWSRPLGPFRRPHGQPAPLRAWRPAGIPGPETALQGHPRAPGFPGAPASSLCCSAWSHSASCRDSTHTHTHTHTPHITHTLPIHPHTRHPHTIPSTHTHPTHTTHPPTHTHSSWSAFYVSDAESASLTPGLSPDGPLPITHAH